MVSDDYKQKILYLVKQRLGITSEVRDEYLEPRIEAAISQTHKQRNIAVDENDFEILMFLTDLSVWQYKNVDSPGAMPVNLRDRLNDLLVSGGGCS